MWKINAEPAPVVRHHHPLSTRSGRCHALVRDQFSRECGCALGRRRQPVTAVKCSLQSAILDLAVLATVQPAATASARQRGNLPPAGAGRSTALLPIAGNDRRSEYRCWHGEHSSRCYPGRRDGVGGHQPGVRYPTSTCAVWVSRRAGRPLAHFMRPPHYIRQYIGDINARWARRPARLPGRQAAAAWQGHLAPLKPGHYGLLKASARHQPRITPGSARQPGGAGAMVRISCT